ncbi:L,D-transpeptidase [Fodinicola acaciae]|uniref:L,D-transpeptidase n=1 Tax=Fodinicola acaciae TaxID=2681555 RepID=UPI0013D0873E|nr:Ig-like domain-containing protein [Fodinicola acaciae]
MARRWHGWTAGIGCVAAVALLATGCSGKTFPAKAAKPAVPAATVAISPATGSQNVPTAGGITVTASGGKVTNVSVKSGGSTVVGDLSADGLTWKSKWALNGAQTYTVTATAVNSAGQTSTQTSTFSTYKPTKFFDTEIGQGSGKTYGVGMPIQLTFDRSITNKAAIEKALEVTTSKPVVGAWYWLDSQHLNFRPQDYWPANTKVTVRGHFNGVAGTSSAYGKDISQTFNIGRSLIAVVGTRTHRMQVYKDGKLVYNWKIATGRPGHDTPNGTYLTINKGNPVRMRPADVQKGESGYYDLMVPWAVRFTWSGIFLHDAYWSVGDQGHRNVSHGCVNMSPSNSKTYYQMELPGDVVTVTGSPLAGSRGDGWTDWFLGWSDVLGKSATHQAVQAGPQGSTLVDPSTLPADPGKAPLTTSAVHNAKAS